MKILEISNYFPEHGGGIEFVAKNLVERWRKRHDVSWMACDDTQAPHSGHQDDIALPSWNFTEERLGFPYPVPSAASLRLIAKHAAGCDVVHLHDSLYAACVAAFLASRRCAKPCLITQHVAAIPYKQGYKNALQAAAYATIGKYLLEHAEGVVFVSGRVQQWFKERMHFSRQPVLLANGVDRQIFRPRSLAERRSIRAGLGISEAELLCLYVGRFTEKKGLQFVRQLAGEDSTTKWLVVGSGEISPEKWELPNVRVRPRQTQAALAEHYAAADLLVLPSAGEGFPLVVQEALSCGLPVAVSEEVAGHIEGSPAFHLDVREGFISESFRAAVSQRSELRRLREAAVEYARRWDWDEVSLQYETMLHTLAAAGKQC